MIELKSPGEIATMAKGGAILAKALQKLKAGARPGITTGQLDELARSVVFS